MMATNTSRAGGGSMQRVVGSLAASAGYTLRFLWLVARVLPAFAGVGCIVTALWFLDWRLGLGALGVALILLDRRI